MAEESKIQKAAESAEDIFGPSPGPVKTPEPKAAKEAAPKEAAPKEAKPEPASKSQEAPKAAKPAAEAPAPAPKKEEPKKVAPPTPKAEEPKPDECKPQPQSLSLNKLEETYSAGTMIFREGQPGDKVYIIKAGLVEIVKRVPNKSDMVLSTLGPGMFFGEMALLDDNPRSAGARAKQKATLYAMTKDAFIGVIKQRPEFALKILEGLCRRLRKADLDMVG